MSARNSTRRRFAAAAASAWLAMVGAAWAEPAPLPLVVEGYDEDAAERLRAALERELGRPVVRSEGAPEGEAVVVTRRAAGRDVQVAYLAPGGQRLERGLRVQGDAERAEGEVALLAGNLARDESSALLARLPSGDAGPSAKAKAEGAGRAADENSCEKRRSPAVALGGDFLPYLGLSSLRDGRAAARSVSLNLLGGLSRGTLAAELAAGVNIDTEFVCGAQLAGAVNVVGGPLDGVQAAGAANVVTGSVLGVQAAGGVNYAGRWVRGAQVSGGVNVAIGPIEGAQVAGAANVAVGDVRGVQLAPVNVAAGRVGGVQIGVVNIAEDADFALGFINVMSKGRLHLDAWLLPEVGLAAAALKHGGRHFHYLYGVGMRAADQKPWYVFGLGAHLPLREGWYVDVDALSYGRLGPRDLERDEGRGINQLRVVAGYSLMPGLALFAGPSANVSLRLRENGRPTRAAYARELDGTQALGVYAWPGLVLGVQGL